MQHGPGSGKPDMFRALRPASYGAQDDAFNPPKLVNGQLVFEVFVLGTRGAGKTVFLAALYNQLSFPDRTNNFFMEPGSEAQRRYLLKTYADIANPDADWPPGNVVVNDFEFGCCYASHNGTIPLFRFKYLDFPGGYVNEEMDGPNSFDVKEAARRAHSILVLLDGQRVLQALEDLPTRGPSLTNDLHALVPVLARCVNRPVHFLVTKWDVLDGKYTLGAIRQELLKNNIFRSFVDQRKSMSLPIHLIPVSALGKDFAEYDRKEMRMKKKKGGVIQPSNVELSIGMTIADQLSLLAHHPAANDLTPLRLALLKLLRYLVKTAGIAAQLADIVALASFLRVDKILGHLTEADEKLQKGQFDLRTQIEEARLRISDQKTAIEAVMMIQAFRTREFRRVFPESDLSATADV
jgi:hypothetical protein